jgi:hypothetical protein
MLAINNQKAKFNKKYYLFTEEDIQRISKHMRICHYLFEKYKL